ncbi:MAG: cell surface protein SprA [Bacteroidales bacterium]|nr:cell surface protein SprA [Bacteroidales bacterium]
MKYIVSIIVTVLCYTALWAIPVNGDSIFARKGMERQAVKEDMAVGETTRAAATIREQYEGNNPPDSAPPRVAVPPPTTNPLDESRNQSPFTLKNPPGTGTKIVYDPETNTYKFQNTTGEVPYGPGAYMDINEYIDYDLRQSINNYWRNKGASYAGGPNRTGGGIIPQLRIPSDVFETIFGGNTIDIRPSGNAEIKFGVAHTSTQNYNLPVKQRRQTRFDFDENIQVNLLAKIGDKIEYNLNYNTESDFEFDNKMKLAYTGKEDEIIKLLEFGDVTMPLNSTLITGSQTLFGVKAQLQFGKLMVTAVGSEQNSETKTITVSGGAQSTDFNFRADEYEENRHFFLSQFFYEHYNDYLSTLPLVNSPIIISKIEVWRTTIGSATQENRNIIAFTDLGEAKPQFKGFQPAPAAANYPDNSANSLVLVVDSSKIRNLNTVSNNLRAIGLTSGTDYEKVENARLLSTNEYTFNSKLGFISLNSALTADQVLAVAFQFQVVGDDRVYQVGEFSNEVTAPNCIRVKLLKSSSLNTRSTLWKLMMKNVYSLQAYQVSSENFRLNILYTGDDEGISNGFFNTGTKKGVALIKLLGMDKLNQQQDPYPDGVFDFIDNAATTGGTINATNGRVYMPFVEPFGKDLRAVLDQASADRYAYDSLYSCPKTVAQQYTAKNKFYIEGTYKSSYGSEYYLNAMNVTEGSVKVSAGGIPLTENVDFTVNYSMGTVSIVNEGILNSGTPITISVENRSTYGITKRRMFGVNFDYVFNPNFTIGATVLNLSERPITPKVNFGEEPINNTIWGMNFAYKTKVPFVTKLVDWLPFHSTTTESNFQIDGEFAHFIPGHSRSIGKEGNSYIDDFEASKSTLDLTSFTYWSLASTPQGQRDLFPEGVSVLKTDPVRKQLAYGFNRALFAWYIIDQIFYDGSTATPNNITKDDMSDPYTRPVYESELFPYREQEQGLSIPMRVLNLAFYPTEKGPFNYDVSPSTYSSGIDASGLLKNPVSRWGGIMRKMEYTDFESANYEYIEFWMMDPFINNSSHHGGKLYLNLGDISEDVLRDGVKFFESGLPEDGSDDPEKVEYTVWGRVPKTQMVTNAFSSQNYQYQDVGFDGLWDEKEREHFDDSYLKLIETEFGPNSQAYRDAYNDPSNDNYHYFRGTDYDNADIKINDRYKKYNNSQGNSTLNYPYSESYPTIANSNPNVEDLNSNNTLEEEEKYYQYEITLSPDKMVVGQNYIVDEYEAVSEPLANGSRPRTKWYQFRVPIKSPDKVVGNISGFNSIRFMRLFMRDFDAPIICRLATFELVKSDWRTYSLSLREHGDYLPGQDDGESSFTVASVSYEENGNRTPIPYVIPPGIEREQGYGTTIYQINEQALSMKVNNLGDGDAKAIYKSTSFDFRQYKRIKMFIHAEDVEKSGDLRQGDLTVFLRLGSDFTNNYYEYEIPVEITPWGVGKDSAMIWPQTNRMEIVLDSLVSAKQERNRAVRSGDHPGNMEPYYTYDEKGNRVTIMGMPNLADVTTIMIGVRNPKKQHLNDGDDMLPKSAEIWVNELRLTGFNDKTGFAALARARLNLADLGDLTLSGSYSSPGFGSLEQSVNDRQQETLYTIDVATNIDGGKILFPEKWNIKIPIHYDYSINMSMPEYNPLNPDVKLLADLREYSGHERDSIRHITTVMTQRQNINLMNVRKERSFDGPIKIRPWDVENLDFSYSYAETKSRDIEVEFDNKYRHEGQLGYTFNNNPKNYRPLGRVKGLKSKWLQLFRDFNFYLLPKSLTIRTGVIRELNEFKLRPKSQGNIIIDTSYVKSFDWSRDYTLMWDLTQALRFEYRAQAQARIDEPQGLIDTRAKKDSIWRSFGQGGRTNLFNQQINASYQIPINKIPIFNWITANVRYTGTYTYTASPLSLSYLGSTIQNGNTIQGNGNINLQTLYNNVPYLKKVNNGLIAKQKAEWEARKKKEKEKAKKEAANKNANPDNLDKDKDKDTDKDKKKKKTGKENVDEDGNKKEEEFKVNIGEYILDGTLRLLMSVRNASINYSESNGNILPGYMNPSNLLGLSFTHKGAPGFLYVFGGQPLGNPSRFVDNFIAFRQNAAEQGWLTDSMSTSYSQIDHNQNISFRATVEPFKDFRIEVTATRMKNTRYSDVYQIALDDDGRKIASGYTAKTGGTFSMTYFALGTFFGNADKQFAEFRALREQMAKRVSNANTGNGRDPNALDPETGYPDGYSAVQQEVLVAAFLASYGGKNPDKVNVKSPFPLIPLPNWRLNYNGFTRLKGMNKYFQNLSLLHAYTSNYNVGSYTTNINYKTDGAGNSINKDALGNFLPAQDIAQLSISQQFAPLVGFDLTLANSLLLKVEYKKRRDVSLSFANTQITETGSDELVLTAGYRFKDLKIGFIFSGMKREVVSDLNLTAGFGLKDNITTLRKVVENQKDISAGTRSYTINVSADYQISSTVGLRFYYDQIINQPHLKSANQYNNTNLECGFSVRLMLAQ